MNQSPQKLYTYTGLLFALGLLAWLPAANAGAKAKASTQAKVQHSQTARDLSFDSSVFEHRAKPDEEVLHASFVMTNNSKQPVKITGLDTSCACLNVRSDKKILAPGEKAKIEADFSLSKLTGTSEKFVYVKTDHPDYKELRLSVRVSIEPLFEIEPKMLSWAVGEESKEKVIKFKVSGDQAVNIVSVTSSKGSVSVIKKVIKPGKEYALVVKPESTANATLGMIRIVTDSKITKHRIQLVYFSVK
ncbi:MAG: DUF1573 domain-containing protein [Verrucomicrobiales bacterium]|nr:DUF1573 domain-containing protein [Verrucomicrobiales bacterium]